MPGPTLTQNTSAPGGKEIMYSPLASVRVEVERRVAPPAPVAVPLTTAPSTLVVGSGVKRTRPWTCTQRWTLGKAGSQPVSS